MNRLLAAAACCLLFLPVLEARAEIYMRVEGVAGDAMRPEYRGWSQVDSVAFKHGVPDPARLDPQRAVLAPITVGKSLGAASIPLSMAVFTGTVYRSVTFDFLAGGTDKPFVYYKILVSNAVFRTASISADADGRPTEELELVGGRIEWSYWPAPGATPVVGRWDVVSYKTY